MTKEKEFMRIRKKKEFTESDARVQFKNGKVMYGVIANYFMGNSERRTVWFIPNHNHFDPDPSPAMLLSEDLIADMELHLK